MNNQPVTTIDLLRHGQTTADDILRGRVDVPLSDNGYQQMQRSVAPYIDQDIPWQHLVTSPLVRCAQFTQDLAQQHQANISTNAGFLEMDYGDWDGRTFEELHNADADLFRKVWQQPDQYSPPNGETFQAFTARITNAWQQLLQQHAGEHILLVCHGGVIRALLGHVMQSSLAGLSRVDVPYACFSRIRVYQRAGEWDWPQLVFHNPHS